MTDKHDRSHGVLLPTEADQETYKRLDDLHARLRGIYDTETAADQVSAHVGELVHGIEQLPRPSLDPLPVGSPVRLVEWMQHAVGDEIDRWLVDFVSASTSCAACSQRWMLHLLTARRTLADWAWARGIERQLGPGTNSHGTTS